MIKPFQIAKTDIHGNLITFWLNENLDYKDRSINCITVSNDIPFAGYKEGDNVFIDTDAVTSHPQSATNKNSP